MDDGVALRAGCPDRAPYAATKTIRIRKAGTRVRYDLRSMGGKRVVRGALGYLIIFRRGAF